MKTDFETLRKKQIEEGSSGKKLLLHACCAPCSTACLERLAADFDVTVYYYNPNMDGVEEYEKRAAEARRFIDEVYGDKVGLIIEKYEPSEFYKAAFGLENLPEGGARCTECFGLRLNKTAEYAKRNGYECICTTLTVSPYKNAPLLNEIGKKAAKAHGVEWIYSDFKKANGYLRSIELSKKYGLYRQNYCGCEFSKRIKSDQ